MVNTWLVYSIWGNMASNQVRNKSSWMHIMDTKFSGLARDKIFVSRRFGGGGFPLYPNCPLKNQFASFHFETA